MATPVRLPSFRRTKKSKKMAATAPTTDVVNPRRNYFGGANGRAMSYSGPSMLADIGTHEDARADVPRSKYRWSKLDKKKSRHGQREAEARNDFGDEEGETPTLIKLRRSSWGIAGTQELLDRRELMIEKRLSLPQEHPRSHSNDEGQKKQGGPFSWERRDRVNSIEVRRTDAPNFAVGNDTAQFWHRSNKFHAENDLYVRSNIRTSLRVRFTR